MRNPALVTILFTPDYSDLRPISRENKSSPDIYSQNDPIFPQLSGSLSAFDLLPDVGVGDDRLADRDLIARSAEASIEFSPEIVTLLSSR